MKELPILMSEPMVLAILAGRKTVTRRQVTDPGLCSYLDYLEKHTETVHFQEFMRRTQTKGPFKKPYGQANDILFVRESWRPLGWSSDDDPELRIQYKADEKHQAFYASEDVCEKIDLSIHAECAKKGVKIDGDGKYLTDDDPISWRPSIHLFKELSRIWLQNIDVSLERLRTISDSDCIAEGIEPIIYPHEPIYWKDYSNKVDSSTNPRWSYSTLWDSINGIGSFQKNPWVWRIEFKTLSTQGRDYIDVPAINPNWLAIP